MNNVSIFSITISVVFIVVVFIEVLIKIYESGCRKKRNLGCCKEFDIKKRYKTFFERVCKREEVLYKSYLLQNRLHYISAFLSLEYSIATMATLLVETPDLMSQIWMPLIIMSCTVVNLCVKPQHRANQYLLAWRKYDAHVQILLHREYESLPTEEIEKIIQDSIKFQQDIESSLSSDIIDRD